MPPWPASKQRPHPWPPVLRQSHHPSRPAVVLVVGSSFGCLIFLGWPPVCCWPRRSCWRLGRGPSCTAATNSVGPTSEPSVPQLSRLPVTTVAKCLRRIGTWSPRWPLFASLLTTAIAPIRGSIAHVAVEKRRGFLSTRFRWDPVVFGWIDLIPGGPSWATPIPSRWPTCWGSGARSHERGPFSLRSLFSPAVGRLVRPLLPSTGLDQQGSGRCGLGSTGAHQLAKIRPDRPSGRLFGPMNG